MDCPAGWDRFISYMVVLYIMLYNGLPGRLGQVYFVYGCIIMLYNGLPGRLGQVYFVYMYYNAL